MAKTNVRRGMSQPKPKPPKPPRPTTYPGYTPVVNASTGFTTGVRKLNKPIIKNA